MEAKNEDKIIKIVYKADKRRIKIFDSYFVKNNKDKCKIIYKGQDYELTDYYNIE